MRKTIYWIVWICLLCGVIWGPILPIRVIEMVALAALGWSVILGIEVRNNAAALRLANVWASIIVRINHEELFKIRDIQDFYESKGIRLLDLSKKALPNSVIKNQGIRFILIGAIVWNETLRTFSSRIHCINGILGLPEHEQEPHIICTAVDGNLITSIQFGSSFNVGTELGSFPLNIFPHLPLEVTGMDISVWEERAEIKRIIPAIQKANNSMFGNRYEKLWAKLLSIRQRVLSRTGFRVDNGSNALFTNKYLSVEVVDHRVGW